jgi:PTS system beta-glucosides-specific IIC component
MAGGGRAGADERRRHQGARAREGPRGTNAWLDSCSSSSPTRSAHPRRPPRRIAVHHVHGADGDPRLIPAWNAPGASLPPSWQFVNLMWQCVFVFLPLMVAYNASQKIGADPWVGFAIMAV